MQVFLLYLLEMTKYRQYSILARISLTRYTMYLYRSLTRTAHCKFYVEVHIRKNPDLGNQEISSFYFIQIVIQQIIYFFKKYNARLLYRAAL